MRRRTALVISAMTGFISLSYELLWFRTFSIATGGMPTVFGILLFVYLSGLALGARASKAQMPDNRKTGDRKLLGNLGTILLVTHVVAFLVVPIQVAAAGIGNGILAMEALGVATCGWGAAFPLLNQYAVGPDRFAGQGLSRVYVANIFGSVAGTLVTGFVLMEYVPLRIIAVLLGVASVALPMWLIYLSAPRRPARIVAFVAGIGASSVCVASAPALFRDLYERLMAGRSITPSERFADVVENRSGVIAVTKSLEVFGGGAYDGVISTSLVHDRNIIERAYAIGALSPSPRRILMIGLSTGAWAQVLANMPGVERLTVVEINPGYLQLIRKYPEVASVLTNPKVDIVIDDGRRWLARNPNRRFDAIVMNTTLHWRANATNLLSREFVGLLRSHLNPGGIAHYNTTYSEDALKTALTIFPFGLRLLNFVTVSDSPVHWDQERFSRILSSYSIDGKKVFDLTQDADVKLLGKLVTMDARPAYGGWTGIESRESVLGRLGTSRIVTDDNMVPEWKNALVWRGVQFLKRQTILHDTLRAETTGAVVSVGSRLEQ